MVFRKGSRRHAGAGKVFVAVMLTMGASAVRLAAIKRDNNNLGGGILFDFHCLAHGALLRRKAQPL